VHFRIRFEADTEGATELAEKHLIKAIGAKYAKMSSKKRVETIRGLSPRGGRFIQKFLPRLYAEAFSEPPQAAGESSESGSRA
jgi:hypothetical protein